MHDTPRSLSPAERRRLLLDTAATVAAYKQRAKDAQAGAKDAKDGACMRLQWTPKTLGVVLAYVDSTSGERADIDEALTLAQQALDRSGMDDLFAPDDDALGSRRRTLAEDGASATLIGTGVEPVPIGRGRRGGGH